ncbi:hypothetical protein M9H77_06433 [Catharanthus roseus]|uniref:Uncharacterized protein n=1 Tax=Catharanthus roseus TaxID=4058 RepID=A0ACC0BSA5_CATRO|nr:hypothetical protein M9H77_06433 [Catharanthus roseus]
MRWFHREKRRSKNRKDQRHYTYHKFMCSRYGFREDSWLNNLNRSRKLKAMTRTGCQACFWVRYDCITKKYIVAKFVRENNRVMTTHEHVLFLRSDRNVTEGDLEQTRTLQGVGEGTSQIMKLFVLQEGGYDMVRFIKKDLYNRIDVDRRKDIANKHTESAVAFLSTMQDMDPMFYLSYDLDEEEIEANFLVSCSAG